MDPFENHSFTLLRKILSFLGFWYTQPYKERVFRYFIIGFLLIFTVVAQLCQITTLDLDLQSIVFVLQIFIPTLSFAAIYCSFILHFVAMREIFNCMKKNWQRLDDAVDLKIMQKYTYESKLFSLICGFMFFFFVSWIVLPSIIHKILFSNENMSSTERFPIFSCIDYILDRETYYYFISVIQIAIIILEVVVAIGCYSAYFMIIQHACALLSVTKNKINQMFKKNYHKDIIVKPIDLSQWMIDIIQRLATIRKFLELVNRLSQKCYLFQMSLAFLLIVLDFLCLVQTPILLQHKETRKDAFAFIFFIIATLSPIYLNCYIGQRIMDYSTNVYKEMCSIPIYDITLNTQKLLLTALTLNAKPCAISIGKVFVSSHEFFSDLLRTSLSFAMVLHSTQHI